MNSKPQRGDFAVGYTLTPLRGWHRGAGLVEIPGCCGKACRYGLRRCTEENELSRIAAAVHDVGEIQRRCIRHGVFGDRRRGGDQEITSLVVTTAQSNHGNVGQSRRKSQEKSTRRGCENYLPPKPRNLIEKHRH